MGLTRSVLKRPVTTILAVLCLIVFGISSVFSSKLELTPEMEMPMVVVFAVYPGANPEDVDQLVTKPIEDEIGTLNGIKSVNSYSNENMSMVLLQYEYGTDMDKAYSDLKKKTDAMKNSLPDDVDTPTIMEFNINDQATMYLAVNNDKADNLYNYVDEKIVPEIEKISSVASVDISGGREEYIKVEVIPEKLKQYHLNINSLVTAVASANLAYPAGSTEVGSQSLSVTTGVDFKDMESLKRIPITLGNGNTIYLEDVANINSTLKDAAGIGRYNGKDTIALGVKKQQKSSAMEVSKAVNRTISHLTEVNPDLEIVVVNDNSDQINSSLISVLQTMIAAVIISMVIIFLFFGDLKASLIVGTSIPVSILAALVMMRVMGFSLNVITLGSLVLGVGMMVDNSIVVLESCFRSTKGKGFNEFHKAALEGSSIVIQSIIGSTATTCVVFLPLAFLSGMTGQMFKPLGFTIVFCMVASLISAMTIVPLCYTMYRPKERNNAPLSGLVEKMQNGYRNIMKSLLPKKKTVMFTTVGLLVISIFLATQLKMELMPANDQGTVSITVELRPGLGIEKANEILTKVEDYVSKDEDVESYMLSYGSSGLSIGGGSSASLTAYLKDDRKRTTNEVVDEWRPVLTMIPDTNITLSSQSAMSMMGGGNDGVEYILQSTQYDELKEASDKIVQALKHRSEVTRIHSSLENSAPVVKIDVDPLKAAAEGLTPAQVGGTVNLMLSGKEATTLDVDGGEISVMVEYPDGEYDAIDQVKGIVLDTPTGGSVALTDIADIYFKDSPQNIIRSDKEYQVTITGDFVKGIAKDDQDALETTIYKEVVLPNMSESITRAQNSMDEAMAEEFSALAGAIALAIFLIFVVMAAQFESPKFSIMVMTTIPFSLIGSFGLMFLADATISMPSLLGFLMLVGTVVNNGILYVDTANQYRSDMDRDTALIEAGATRLRPILMTTLTTVVAMIPMALAIGDSGEMMQGMALVNVGGLMASTTLSLLMLPIYYTLMNRGHREELDVD
ncbi:efflux RND transporter permease subunit [[Clostridium] symbiosum]|uniref:efflux RND transporter permease subunit n=1 Tax=Clostridium symbiosum TaxID=1512 RepID=UPI001D086D0D|nr:efflux RND transporter permease subunit [[Clostridium] symbiosum]MCB6608173.1 efflux RND transporter permease subunit [[Clostridium] symbiosum]MCB6930873.1 efflux RND transporter permease subunit [[Clostridium] symbiosum]